MTSIAVTCTISKRTNGISNSPKHVYHLKQIITKTVEIDAIANAISESFSLTHADLVACLSALNSQIIFNLKSVHKIDLAWFSHF